MEFYLAYIVVYIVFSQSIFYQMNCVEYFLNISESEFVTWQSSLKELRDQRRLITFKLPMLWTKAANKESHENYKLLCGIERKDDKVQLVVSSYLLVIYTLYL